MDLAKQKIELIKTKLNTISNNNEKIILHKLNDLNKDLDMILYHVNDLYATINNSQTTNLQNRDDGDCWSGNCMWINQN